MVSISSRSRPSGGFPHSVGKCGIAGCCWFRALLCRGCFTLHRGTTRLLLDLGDSSVFLQEIICPSIQINSVKGHASRTEPNFSYVRSHGSVEAVAVHAEVSRCITHSDESRLNVVVRIVGCHVLFLLVFRRIRSSDVSAQRQYDRRAKTQSLGLIKRVTGKCS